MRYDGVVHLVTAADGAPSHYKYGVVEDDSGGQVRSVAHPHPYRTAPLCSITRAKHAHLTAL